jgi:hypothetical protein
VNEIAAYFCAFLRETSEIGHAALLHWDYR